jgi:hypothetical protein
MNGNDLARRPGVLPGLFGVWLVWTRRAIPYGIFRNQLLGPGSQFKQQDTLPGITVCNDLFFSPYP